MPNKVVKLDIPLSDPLVKELIFRDPSMADYFAVGDCYVWPPGDEVTAQPIFENLKRYAVMLLVDANGQPGNTSVFEKISVVDAVKVKAAIMGFFLRADPASAAYHERLKTSSSATTGTPAP